MSEPQSLTEQDLEDLRGSVAEVLGSQCDSMELHAFIDGKSKLDETLWFIARDLGWLAIAAPESYGGLGGGTRGSSMLHRELGRYLAPGSFISTLTAALWLAEVGRAPEKKAYLAEIGAGKLRAVIPTLLGPECIVSMRENRLYGEVRVLGPSDAKLALVPFGAAERIEGWALIECDNQEAQLVRLQTWDRTRQLCTLRCDAASAAYTIADPLGALGDALARHLALAVASDSIGGAAAIALQTIEYLKTRSQFDRPIGSFQALKHRAADLMTRITAGEHLVEQAVESCASGDPDAGLWAALAKAGATEAYSFVAGDCVQLHGGVGHTWEFDVHLHVKRARLNESLGACSGAQRDIAAHALAAATRSGRTTMELGF